MKKGLKREDVDLARVDLDDEGRKPSLMKKGLKRVSPVGIDKRTAIVSGSQTIPDEEGIETTCRCTRRCCRGPGMSQTIPDEEGIETEQHG